MNNMKTISVTTALETARANNWVIQIDVDRIDPCDPDAHTKIMDACGRHKTTAFDYLPKAESERNDHQAHSE